MIRISLWKEKVSFVHAPPLTRTHCNQWWSWRRWEHLIFRISFHPREYQEWEQGSSCHTCPGSGWGMKRISRLHIDKTWQLCWRWRFQSSYRKELLLGKSHSCTTEERRRQWPQWCGWKEPGRLIVWKGDLLLPKEWSWFFLEAVHMPKRRRGCPHHMPASPGSIVGVFLGPLLLPELGKPSFPYRRPSPVVQDHFRVATLRVSLRCPVESCVLVFLR